MRKAFSALLYIFSLSLLLSVMSISSYGQNYISFSSELDQILRRAKWQIGPFRIYPRIQFRNIGYDDNVYFRRKEDYPISDYTATISPEVKVYSLLRNWLILSFSENPEYVHFVKEKRERAFNNSFSPGLRLRIFGRFVISGNYQSRRAKRRSSSEFDVRVLEKVKGYNGSFFYETPRKSSFGFSGSIIKVSYEDITLPGLEIPLSRALNREERSGKIELYYKLFSQSFFFLSGGYTEYKFEHQQSQWRDSYSYQAYSGIRFPLLGRVRGTLALGYKKLVPREEEKKDFSGLVGNISLNFMFRRISLRFRYSRDFRFSYSANNIYFIEDTYGAGISFYLTKFLRLDYDYFCGEANYNELILLQMPGGQFEEIKIKNIFRIHVAGFAVNIIRNIGIGIRINFWEMESNYYLVNRNRMLVAGYVTYEF